MTGTTFPLQRAVLLLTCLTTFCLLTCPPAGAAGFDCQQAGTSVERQICGDEDLSALDGQLNEIYQALRESANAVQRRALTSEQRQWLRSRNQCSDLACLQASYDARLNELDPLTDHQLTCAEMRAHPERLPSDHDIDLGSGSGSPNQFDSDCPESLEQLDFLQDLRALAGLIRSEGGRCSGTIVYAQGRHYAYSLTLAGFRPQDIPPGPTAARPGPSWNDFSTIDGSASSLKSFAYFRLWADLSPYNHQLYTDFAAGYERALPRLVRHFQDHNAMTRSAALVAAKNALMLLVDWAAGHAPGRLMTEESALVQRVRSGSFRPEQVNNEDFRYTDDEVYNALRVALVNRASLPVIEALGGRLDLSRPERFVARPRENYYGMAMEPLLSLATADIASMQYLLGRGFPVDTANGFGKSALFYAIGFSQRNAVQLLLRAGADVNHAYKSAQELNPDGYSCNYPNLQHTRRTPLMHAAQNSDLPMVQLLLQAGANQSATDDLGFNALDYAAMGKHPDIETFLKSLGLQYRAPGRQGPLAPH